MSSIRSLGPLPVAIALAFGIAFATLLDHLAVPASPRWLVALACVVLAARRRGSLPLVIAAVVAAGAARGARRAPEPPAGIVVDDRTVDRVAGVVGGPVIHTRRGTGALLAPDTGDPIWIWADVELAAGERIAVTGAVRTPRGSLGPAEPDRRDALLARGARFEVVARTVERLADDPGAIARIWRWAAATQVRWSARVEAAGGPAAARAAVRGIVIGDRTRIPEDLDARWRAAGVYHVLSVSGLHLAVIAGLAFALLRRVFAASPFGGRIRAARWAAPPALALAIAYTLVTGAQLATLRALVVIALALIAAMLDRPLRLADAIGAAAIVILAWRPADLFDPSFQLSFTAALTLALAPPAAGDTRGIRARIGAWIARGLATSAWVAITTAPITAYHFQQVTPGGVVGNLVLTPVLELAALPLALAGLALDWELPIRCATAIVALVDDLAGVLAHALPIGRVAAAGAPTVAILVALSLVLAWRRQRTRVDAIGWLALCLVWSIARQPPSPGELRVTFIDVGQGDAAVIELPDGAVWLVDAGGNPGAPDLAAAAAPGRAITRLLALYGHDQIDLAIVSHPHPDHYLGLAAVELPVRELWSVATPPGELEPAGFVAIARALAGRGTRLVHPPLGVARVQAGVELIVWGPRYQAAAGAPVVEAADPVRTINDNSLVVEVRYRGRALLFTGDLEAEGERDLVDAGIAPVDVIKVAHHGSPTSSVPALVDATRPALAVISCGRVNRYGFPAPAVVARWAAGGAEVARTDLDGAITVRVDAAGGLAVERFAPAEP